MGGAGRHFREKVTAALRGVTALPIPPGDVRVLDGWRGLCILLVLAGHFVPGWMGLAEAGVQFFFALSGMLMADILLFKRQPAALFVRRRIARIVPALALYVAVIGSLVNFHSVARGTGLVLESPLGSLLFLHNYVPADRTGADFQHMWSLAVEEHAYLLLVAIAVLCRRNALVAALSALAICALTFANFLWLQSHPPEGMQALSVRSDVRISSVLLPFAAALLLRGCYGRKPPVHQAWSVCATTGAVAICLLFGLESSSALAAATVLSALAVVSLDSSGDVFRRLLESPSLIWAGTLSFSLYLWQQPFFIAYAHGRMGLLPALAWILLCGLVSFKLIESPARKFLNSRWTSKGDEAAAAAGGELKRAGA